MKKKLTSVSELMFTLCECLEINLGF